MFKSVLIASVLFLAPAHAANMQTSGIFKGNVGGWSFSGSYQGLSFSGVFNGSPFAGSYRGGLFTGMYQGSKFVGQPSGTTFTGTYRGKSFKGTYSSKQTSPVDTHPINGGISGGKSDGRGHQHGGGANR